MPSGTMGILSDYIDKVTLKELQQSFSAAAGCAVGFLDGDGNELVVGEAVPPDDRLEFPIRMDGDFVGNLYMDRAGRRDAGASHHHRLGALIAEMVCRIGTERKEVRSRIEQLIALHRVTAEISQGTELQHILETVTKTVVDTMKQKASSIRLLSASGKELMIYSAHSFSPQYMDLRPIPLAESDLDREVLNSDRPVYVEDMTSDPRVRDPDSARKEGVVSALCAPMLFEGKPEGVLRVFSEKKHVFDWFEWQLLRSLANAAAAAIVHARNSREARLSWEMKRQLRLAAEVQRRMIPARPPSVDGLAIADYYDPSQQLSGDFYDYIVFPDNRLGFVICDVVGKGIRASLLMASIRASLQAHAVTRNGIAETLGAVNRDLVRRTLSNDFATMFYCELDLNTMNMAYCCAGHLPPVLVRNGTAAYLETSGGMIGVVDDMVFPVGTQELKTGDCVVMYTDGLVEAMNYEGQQYGRKRAEEAVVHAVTRSYDIRSTLQYCVWDMRRFAGLNPRKDDLTMIGIRVL